MRKSLVLRTFGVFAKPDLSVDGVDGGHCFGTSVFREELIKQKCLCNNLIRVVNMLLHIVSSFCHTKPFNYIFTIYVWNFIYRAYDVVRMECDYGVTNKLDALKVDRFLAA